MGQRAERGAEAAVGHDRRGASQDLVLRHPALDRDVGRQRAELGVVALLADGEEEARGERRQRVDRGAVERGIERQVPAGRDRAEAHVDQRLALARRGGRRPRRRGSAACSAGAEPTGPRARRGSTSDMARSRCGRPLDRTPPPPRRPPARRGRSGCRIPRPRAATRTPSSRGRSGPAATRGRARAGPAASPARRARRRSRRPYGRALRRAASARTPAAAASTPRRAAHRAARTAGRSARRSPRSGPARRRARRDRRSGTPPRTGPAAPGGPRYRAW